MDEVKEITEEEAGIMLKNVVAAGIINGIGELAVESTRNEIKEMTIEFIKKEIIPELHKYLKASKKQMLKKAEKVYAELPAVMATAITEKIKEEITSDFNNILNLLRTDDSYYTDE